MSHYLSRKKSLGRKVILPLGLIGISLATGYALSHKNFEECRQEISVALSKPQSCPELGYELFQQSLNSCAADLEETIQTAYRRDPSILTSFQGIVQGLEKLERKGRLEKFGHLPTPAGYVNPSLVACGERLTEQGRLATVDITEGDETVKQHDFRELISGVEKTYVLVGRPGGVLESLENWPGFNPGTEGKTDKAKVDNTLTNTPGGFRQYLKQK